MTKSLLGKTFFFSPPWFSFPEHIFSLFSQASCWATWPCTSLWSRPVCTAAWVHRAPWPPALSAAQAAPTAARATWARTTRSTRPASTSPTTAKETAMTPATVPLPWRTGHSGYVTVCSAPPVSSLRQPRRRWAAARAHAATWRPLRHRHRRRPRRLVERCSSAALSAHCRGNPNAQASGDGCSNTSQVWTGLSRRRRANCDKLRAKKTCTQPKTAV